MKFSNSKKDLPKEQIFDYYINETFKKLRYKQNKYGLSATKVECPSPFSPRKLKSAFNKTEILLAQTPTVQSDTKVCYDRFKVKSNSQTNTLIDSKSRSPALNLRAAKSGSAFGIKDSAKPISERQISSPYLFEKLKPSQAFKLRCKLNKKPNKIERFYLEGNNSIEKLIFSKEIKNDNDGAALIHEEQAKPDTLKSFLNADSNFMKENQNMEKLGPGNDMQIPFKLYDTSYLQRFFLKELKKGNTILEKFFDEEELDYFLGKSKSPELDDIEEVFESPASKRLSMLYANKIKKSLKRNSTEDKNFVSNLINTWRDSTKKKRRRRRYFTKSRNDEINYDSVKFKLKALILRLSRLRLRFSELPFVFPKKPFEKKGSFLFFQALRHENRDLIEKMLQNSRFYLFDFDFKGRTPLHIAAKKGLFDICKILMKYFPDVDKTDLYNRTPLFYSIAYGHRKITKLLLYHRADPWSKGSYVYTKMISPDDIESLRALKSARKLDLAIRFSPLRIKSQIWNTQRIGILKAFKKTDEM